MYHCNICVYSQNDVEKFCILFLFLEDIIRELKEIYTSYKYEEKKYDDNKIKKRNRKKFSEILLLNLIKLFIQ